MNKYIVIITGDWNDCDFDYTIEVLDEEELDHLKDIWHSTILVLEHYKELNPDCYVTSTGIPSLTDAWDNLFNDYCWNYYCNGVKETPPGFEGCEHLLEDYYEFMEDYSPYGANEYNRVHQIVNIKAYRLADDKPICFNVRND